MKTSANELLAEIKQIRTQYLAEVGVGGYKVWPKSIRDRVLVYADLVGSTKKAAALCEISAETIYQWRAETKRTQFKSLPVVQKSSKSVTVTDSKPKSPNSVQNPSVTVTVTTPEGFTIAGLDAEQALAILLKLGGRKCF